MMGATGRTFVSLINVSLEDLVPQDHCYRHLERSLELTSIRSPVEGTKEPPRCTETHRHRPG